MTEKIWIVTDAESLIVDDTEGTRGWSEEVQQRMQAFRERQLDAGELERKMGSFLQIVGRIFNQVERHVPAESGIKLDEIELSIEISAEGEIKLVAGGKASGKGAIKLKFKRAALPPNPTGISNG